MLSKWRFPGADAVFTLFRFGMFIPYQAIMIPLARPMNTMHLMGRDVPLLGGTIPLIVAHVVYGIPICTLIFRNYYMTIPTGLIEAAKADCAGLLRTCAWVVLPLSAPAFAVVLICQFTSMWNDFLFAASSARPTVGRSRCA